MNKLELRFGGGDIDIVLDLSTGSVELYLGGGFGYAWEESDPNHFHARHGGRQYYGSRSGLSGAGWVPAKPTLKKVHGYRTDVSVPWISLGDFSPNVGEKEVWVPFEYQGSCISSDWPVVVRDGTGQITFCSSSEVARLLRGELETEPRQYRIRYIKDADAEPRDFVVSVNEPTRGDRWASARRLIELLYHEELSFQPPEGWEPEGDSEFWRRLGLCRLPDAFYKVVRGIARDRYSVEEINSIEGLQKAAPANVHVLAPHLYVQERGRQYVGVGRFMFDDSWYDYEVYLESERAFRLFAGNREEIASLEQELETGAHEKHVRALTDGARHEEAARETLARDEHFRELLEANADVEVSVEDSLAAGNCRPGTDEFVQRFFPGRTTATVKELSRFVSVWGVRRTLEHKLLPSANARLG